MLRKTAKEITRHSMIYSIGWFANSFTSILLLPVYTRYMTRADYGVLEMIDLTKGVLTILIVTGLTAAVGKFYNDAKTATEQQTVITTSLFYIIISSVFWFFVIFFYNEQVSSLILGDLKYLPLFNIFIVSIFFEVLSMVNLIFFQVKGLSRLYVYVSSSKLLINIALSLLFIVYYNLGAKGMLLGNLITAGIYSVALTINTFKRHGRNYDLKLQKEMIRFGTPFIPALIGGLCMHGADRYLLRSYTSLEIIAIYSLGYKFPFMLSSLLMQSFGRIWRSKTVFNVAESPDAPHIYGKITTYFLTVFVIAQYTLSVCSNTLITVMAAPDYHDAYKVVPVISLAVCFYSMHNFFTIGALVKKKTKYVPISFLSACFVNIILNWHFIPIYGYMAAAWISVLTYIIFSSIGFIVYRKIYTINFEFSRLFFLIFAATSLGTIATIMTFENMLYEIIKELVFILLLPTILLTTSFLLPNERRELYDKIKGLRLAAQNFLKQKTI